MKKKIIGIFVSVILILIGFVPVSGAINESVVKKSSAVKIPDSYVINNVPYVSQGSLGDFNFYCSYATATMIFLYYGINTSLSEVLYNFGVGYSFGYKFKLPLLGWSSATVSQEAKGREFLAYIYGLKYSNWRCDDKSISDDIKWQMYWTKVTENISKNIPVITGINAKDLPYIDNASGGHFIVLVGYNQTNNTVCIHDPGAIGGSYIYIPIDCIKNTILSTIGVYFLEIFEDTSDEPLSKEEAFRLAHARNLERMKGIADAYDDYNLDGDFNLQIFGINALKFLKHSYKIRNIILLNPNYIESIELNSFLMYVEKHNMSQYLMNNPLLQNKELYPTLEFEAFMLEIQANNWALLDYKCIELYYTPSFRILAKISIMNEMRNILDIIINIEEDILKGPPEWLIQLKQ